MKRFNFAQCEITVELPDEYLTLGHHRTLRKLGLELQKKGKIDDKGNLINIDEQDWTYEAINKLLDVDLNQVPLNPENLQIVQDLCAHFTKLMIASQKIGHDIVDEVEQKKQRARRPRKRREGDLARRRNSRPL